MRQNQKEVVAVSSAQVSVRLDGARYNLLKKSAQATGKTHKEILIEGFDLWLRENG